MGVARGGGEDVEFLAEPISGHIHCGWEGVVEDHGAAAVGDQGSDLPTHRACADDGYAVDLPGPCLFAHGVLLGDDGVLPIVCQNCAVASARAEARRRASLAP